MNRAFRSTRLAALAIIAAAFALTGCYHAVVETGRAPSSETVEEKWAHSFLWGLVPPETVETASRCPNGVARVETEHSFLNQLASFVTWGIYSPMTIRATCAASDDDADAADLLVPAGATRDQREEAIAHAALLSVERAAPVYVRFATD